MKNICEELFLKKLAASALAVLINADYILTGYVTECLHFDVVLKLKTIHGRTYHNKTKKPC